MIVLDEQLLGRNIEGMIKKWYRGSVQIITEFRPHTVIKDEAVSTLLLQQNKPTFVTINEKDFWQKVAIDYRYCIVCFALPDSRVREIPSALRLLFQHKQFRTKAQRMGKIVRVAGTTIRYYTSENKRARVLRMEVG